MKATQLIKELQALVEKHGDRKVYHSVPCGDFVYCPMESENIEFKEKDWMLPTDGITIG